MLFLCNSRVREGVNREQVIDYLRKGNSEETWKLFKRGTITHCVFKLGEQPGVALMMNCADLKEAQELLNASPPVRDGILVFEIDPAQRFRDYILQSRRFAASH
jgi:hypothetical protein